MNKPWPSFETWDLDRSPEGDAEMIRRWGAYHRDMKVLIASGGVHQDEDGWWVDDATGELIGPDPEIERPLTDKDIVEPRSFAEVFPELAASIARSHKQPRLGNPKQQVTLRLDADVLERLRASGPDWQARVNDTLRRSLGLEV